MSWSFFDRADDRRQVLQSGAHVMGAPGEACSGWGKSLAFIGNGKGNESDRSYVAFADYVQPRHHLSKLGPDNQENL